MKLCAKLCVLCIAPSLLLGQVAPPAPKSGADGTASQPASQTPSPPTQQPGTSNAPKEKDAFQDLAEKLVETDTDAKRTALLEANHDLITSSLESALSAAGAARRPQGDYANAQVSYQLRRQVAERTNHPAGVWSALRSLGIVARLQQKYPEALDYFQN